MNVTMGCHYRQNSAIITFVNGASNFVYGTFVFINGASVFVNGASNFVYGAFVFINGASNFVYGAFVFTYVASKLVNREFKIRRLQTTATDKHATAHHQNHLTVHFSCAALRLR